jgi:hypothetical protein
MSKAERKRDSMGLTRNSESLIPTSLNGNMAKKKWKRDSAEKEAEVRETVS